MRLASTIGVAVAVAVLLAGCGGSGNSTPDILFVSTRDGSYGLYGMNADGGHQHRVTKEGGDPSTPEGLYWEVDPDWSPLGQRIAFASRRAGGSGVYVMDADGKNLKRLSPPGAVDSEPTWSPDGKQIAFVRGTSGRIEVMGASGGKAHRLTKLDQEEVDPAWSPDGRWIAYVQLRSGTPIRELWLVHPDGSDNHQLTNLQKSADTPSWSPDGKKLVFSSDYRGKHFGIYTIDATSANLRVISLTTIDEIEPSFSPDGTRIAYSRDGAIVTVDPDGRNEKVITDPKNNDSSPVWNPAAGAGKSG